jgi:carbon monoxide dehydrogenase subunit G
MIETEQTVVIAAGIDRVWDFARDIRGWASLMPGMQDCEVIDDDNSRWVLKVGVGGLVRTVKVRVHVDQWDGPGRVLFAYKLEGDPVEGGGSYTATARGPGETEVVLQVQVKGGGPMAPMWEAMGRPLLPQLAKGFAGEFKARIEASTPGSAAAVEAPPRRGLLGWLARLWRAWFGARELR